jgi:hypothetical protein
MFSTRSAVFHRFAAGATQSPAMQILFAAAIVFAVTSAASATTYKFANVAVTGVDTSDFTSQNGKGTISVTHTHGGAGAATLDNVNTAINNKFSILFPGTGNVDGHLAQTHYNATITVTFDLSLYTITPRTAFGIWNTTDEVSPGPGSSAIYNLQLLNANNNVVSPTTFQLIGNQDNEADTIAHTKLLMDPSTGDITPGPLVHMGAGIHMDAAFWKKIPVGTQQIIFTGNLPPLNNQGDGIGFYFADVPEPSTAVMATICLFVAVFGRRRH